MQYFQDIDGHETQHVQMVVSFKSYEELYLYAKYCR